MTARVTFQVVAADGSVPSDNPKLDAYKYLWTQVAQGRGYALRVEDGRYTCAVDGQPPVTFSPRGDA